MYNRLWLKSTSAARKTLCGKEQLEVTASEIDTDVQDPIHQERRQNRPLWRDKLRP
jgi:hypothetical protein